MKSSLGLYGDWVAPNVKLVTFVNSMYFGKQLPHAPWVFIDTMVDFAVVVHIFVFFLS